MGWDIAVKKIEVHMNKDSMLKYIRSRYNQNFSHDDITCISKIFKQFQKEVRNKYSQQRINHSDTTIDKALKCKTDDFKYKEKMMIRSDFKEVYSYMLDLCTDRNDNRLFLELKSIEEIVATGDVTKREPYFWLRKDIRTIDAIEEKRREEEIDKWKSKKAEEERNTVKYDSSMSKEEILQELGIDEDINMREILEDSVLADISGLY